MTMIQITEEKKEQMSEMIDKAMHCMGKVMQCVDNLDEEDEEFGMREPDDYDDDMGYRGGGRMGMRSRMGMRRGRNSMGRYTRY